ncbi:MAG: glycosyltransferase family 4 protein [Clostridiales bacterium]|nr:glycosyltransferase family 4 protein [Clostridiales bacterium]
MDIKIVKILLASPLPPPIGGIASWTVEYMNQMSELGCTPILVNTSVTGKRIQNSAKVNFFDEFIRLRSIKKNIKNAICDSDINVIHYNASCFTFGLIRDYFVLRSFFRKVPVVYHCHCNLETNVNNWIARFFFLRIVERSNYVLTLNKKSFQFAKQYTDNIKIIPNFIERIYVDNVQVRSELKDIAFVGRVCAAKGIYELIEAAKNMKNINFHIIGPDDNHILDNISDTNIILHGPQSHDQVIELLKTMDAMILPSYTEGFPLVVMEGMACGLPIIATEVGSIPDMIEDKGGILIPMMDSNAIVEAVQHIHDSYTRQAMAAYNLNKVKNEYLSKCVLKKIMSIYEKLVLK